MGLPWTNVTFPGCFWILRFNLPDRRWPIGTQTQCSRLLQKKSWPPMICQGVAFQPSSTATARLKTRGKGGPRENPWRRRCQRLDLALVLLLHSLLALGRSAGRCCVLCLQDLDQFEKLQLQVALLYPILDASSVGTSLSDSEIQPSPVKNEKWLDLATIPRNTPPKRRSFGASKNLVITLK